MTLPHPSEYLEQSAFEPSGVATLFYPGAGTDFGPLSMVLGAMHSARNLGSVCSEFGFLSAFYVDYAVDGLTCVQDFLIKNIPDELGPHLGSVHNPILTSFSPSDFGSVHRDFFSPESLVGPEEQEFFGLRCVYPEWRLSLTYIKGDALATLKVMARRGIHPNIVVLQDHGWGQQWFHFSGPDSPLIKVAKHAPKYLYVGDNSSAWPGYDQVSEYVVHAGQGTSRPHARALFVKAKGHKSRLVQKLD
jgi:hypothetical protein